MLKNLVIISLLCLVIYLYYQQRKNASNSDYPALESRFQEVVKVNKIFASFCQNEIGGKDIEEIRRKLKGKKLTEILEENEDYELEIDTLRRTKGELEADLLSQSNSFKSLQKEKDGTIRRLEKEKKDLQEFGKRELEKLKTQLEALKKNK